MAQRYRARPWRRHRCQGRPSEGRLEVR
jgi:hypothetical protein